MKLIVNLIVIILLLAYLYYLATFFRVKNNLHKYVRQENFKNIGEFQCSIIFDYGDTNSYFKGKVTLFLLGDIIVHTNTIEILNNQVTIDGAIPYFRVLTNALKYDLSIVIESNNELNGILKDNLVRI
jgi:hypothetical protein